MTARPRPVTRAAVLAAGCAAAATALGAMGAAQAQDYRFPTSDADYGHFYPTAYMDQGGTTDWNCGGVTYSGHGGSDFGGGSWSGMDEGRDIVAAANGVVVDTHDGEYDRCDTGTCGGGGGYGNYVKIEHADGKSTIYAHLKEWSVAVSVGATVTCGQKLGEMGSSGNSTGPHVHFEVRTAGDSRSDPFDGPCSAPPTYWVDQGVYEGLPGAICEDVAPCSVVGRLRCGESIVSANNGSGSTSVHGAYGGCVEYVYSGPEIAFEFATELAETATLRLTGLGADLDLLLLSSEACDGTGCLAGSVNSDASDEAVTFSAAAGQRYVVVVDGWEGAVSGFSLSAECAGGWPGEGGDGDDDTTPPADDDSAPADDDSAPADDDSAPADDDTVGDPGGGGQASTLPETEDYDGCGGCATGAPSRPAARGAVLVGVAALAAMRRGRSVRRGPRSAVESTV